MTSITKTFTAVVVLQLVSEGALSLDDPVEDWLPGLLSADDRVTVRHLLSHRSGIVEDAEALLQRRRRWTAEEILASARALPTSPPGASYVGYVALGRLVEEVTDAPYERAVQERILDPLGLADTGFPDADAAAAHEVRGYRVPPVGDEADGWLDVTCTWFGPGAVLAAGGLVSTTSDVATFYAALLDRGPARALLLDAMQHTECPHYFLGPVLEQAPCGHAYGNDGEVPGFTTGALSSPDEQTTVVLVLNGCRVDLMQSVERLLCEVAP